MKNIKNSVFILLVLTIFILQILLIAHRLSFEFNLLTNFYKKDYGLKESLSINNKFKHALQIKDLINKNEIKKFKVSKKLYNHISFQRIVEVSYPSKFISNSKNYFAFRDEKTKDCFLIDSLNEIVLYECRN